jgi:hypothetical protein
MAKKKKNDIDIHSKKVGKERRQELLEEITSKDTFLPEGIMHEDMDKGMLEFITEKLLTVAEGKAIPVLKKIFTLQRWAEFVQTWGHQDSDGNVELPFIAIVRRPDPQPGTHPALLYTIPDRKTFYYTKVPTWDGTQYGALIYKIPQPVPIDLEYEVILVCDKMRTLNPFNKVVLQKFASRQAYTKIKGHYIPIVLDNISDESQISNIEERRYYQQVYKFRMEGILIDEDEFEIKPAVNRMLIKFDFMKSDTTKVKKIFNGVEVSSITLKADGLKTVFNVGQPIGILLAVMIDGQVKTRVDFSFNEDSTNVVFNTSPGAGKNVTILFITSKTVRLFEFNQVVTLRQEDFTTDVTGVYELTGNVDEILFVTLDGNVVTSYTLDASNKLNFASASGSNLSVYYLINDFS